MTNQTATPQAFHRNRTSECSHCLLIPNWDSNFVSIMYPSEISGVIVSSEEFGCAYTVCTEGELFYEVPIHENGDANDKITFSS